MTQPVFLTILAVGLALSRPAYAQEFDCVIEPAIVVELASPVGGLIGEIDVSRGDAVSKGQQIARLESDGTLDESFPTSVVGVVYSLFLQSDGKILVGNAGIPHFF